MSQNDINLAKLKLMTELIDDTDEIVDEWSLSEIHEVAEEAGDHLFSLRQDLRAVTRMPYSHFVTC